MMSTWNRLKALQNDAGQWRIPLALLLIAVVTVATYWPVLHNGFIDYDDTDYVTLNMAVRQGLTLKGLYWSATAFHAGNWHPLTWLSHMLDVQLFGLKPMGHHLTSLLLHVANAMLVCMLLYRLTGYLGRGTVVALLFAIHPLHVESVAWVAERKDVLSTFFWLLTMLAYTSYTRRPGLARYLLVAVLFALGLMTKQMLVTLPLVLLIMDYWPLERTPANVPKPDTKRSSWTQLIQEKAALLALSGVAALITLFSQDSAGALGHGGSGAVLLQAGNAFISYLKYIGKMFWPADLALFYPFEPSSVTFVKVVAALVFLALTSVIVVAQRREHPYLLLGWFWYLITMLPVIGFIRVGGQAMADRYSYIPLIGLFLMIVWGTAELALGWRNGRSIALMLTGATIVVLCLLTNTQTGYWQNSYQLYKHALDVVDNNWLAHNNMGILLSQRSRNDEAIIHFQESVRINPYGSAGYRNLGNAYQMSGRNAEAVAAFREAVRVNPDDAESYFRLGYAYLLSASPDLAYQQYLQLSRLDSIRAGALLDSIRTSRGNNQRQYH